MNSKALLDQFATFNLTPPLPVQQGNYMKVTALTLLILQINKAVDSGNYTSITVKDVQQAIEEGRVLRFLQEECKGNIDLSLHLEGGAYSNFPEIFEAEMKNMLYAHGGNERRKWGIENSGLCLILAWTNEIIQQGKFHFTGVLLSMDG